MPGQSDVEHFLRPRLVAGPSSITIASKRPLPPRFIGRAHERLVVARPYTALAPGRTQAILRKVAGDRVPRVKSLSCTSTGSSAPNATARTY